MKRILVISFSDLKKDPRVYRQIRFLKDAYDITAAGLESPEIEGVNFIRLELNAEPNFRKLLRGLQLKLGLFEQYYRERFSLEKNLQRLAGKEFDLVLANDIDALPLAVKAARGAKILFDAHEYAPGEFEDRRLWRMLNQPYRKFLCDTYIPRSHSMTTVAEGIADAYRRVFGAAPLVITNACDYADLLPSPVEPGRIRLIHHGIAIPSRNLDIMVSMAGLLDERFSLDLMLVTSPSSARYLSQLKRLAKKHRNIRFIDPVPMAGIVKATNAYDIGVFILKPNNFNYAHALPNKFFEFVQARLAVAVGPSPEMARIVRRYDLGLVSDDFSPETMAQALNSLTAEQIVHYKAQSHNAAFVLSSASNKERLHAVLSAMSG